MIPNPHRAALVRLTGLALALGLVPALAATQTTGLLTFFLPDSEPTSLDASVIAVNTAGTDPVTTMQLAWPTAASPENDACRAAGIYPAQVYHTQGSVFGGTTTYSADDSTTTWRCELGENSAGRAGGTCSKTIVSKGTTRTESDDYNTCYVLAHQRPVVVTAGLDKVKYYLTMDVSAYISAKSSELAQAKCPASKTTIWAGAVAGSATSAASSTAATTSASSTGGSLAVTSTTQTGTATSSSASHSAATGGTRPIARLLAGMGAVAVLGTAL